MYGLIGKMIAVPGERDALAGVLLEGTREMPGCLSYVVANDATDQDALWITEMWESPESHQASLALPAGQAAIGKGRPMIAGFGERMETVRWEARGCRRACHRAGSWFVHGVAGTVFRSPAEAPMNRRAIILTPLLLLAACADPLLSPHVVPNDEAPYIVGTIISRDDRFQGTPSARVAARPDDPEDTRRADVTLGGSPIIAWRSGGSATLEDLRPGRVVSVWVTGPELRSYPVVVGARIIVIER